MGPAVAPSQRHRSFSGPNTQVHKTSVTVHLSVCTCVFTAENPPANGRLGFDPWVGKTPGEENGNLLQYPCLENPTEEPGGQRSKAVTKSRTRLSDCITTTIYQRDSTAQVLVRNTKLFLGLSYKWTWSSNTVATWCKELAHLQRPWCWERLRAGREGINRGWDGWMASLTRWKWL